MCDKNTWPQATVSFQTHTTLNYFNMCPLHIYCQIALIDLPVQGEESTLNLLSLSAVMALIWPREITPPAEKHKRRQGKDGHTEHILRLGLHPSCLQAICVGHPSCLQAVCVGWGGQRGGQGRVLWSHSRRCGQIQ